MFNYALNHFPSPASCTIEYDKYRFYYSVDNSHYMPYQSMKLTIKIAVSWRFVSHSTVFNCYLFHFMRWKYEGIWILHGQIDKSSFVGASNCCCNGNFWFIVSAKEFDLIFQIIDIAGWLEACRKLSADYSVVSLHFQNSSHIARQLPISPRAWHKMYRAKKKLSR